MQRCGGIFFASQARAVFFWLSWPVVRALSFRQRGIHNLKKNKPIQERFFLAPFLFAICFPF